jgi:hypothetical protein
MHTDDWRMLAAAFVACDGTSGGDPHEELGA